MSSPALSVPPPEARSQPIASASAARIEWLDTAKGVGIVLVAAGHVFGDAGPGLLTAQYVIYLFHMPLFFLLSGWTQKRRDLPTVARTRTLRLLLPYLSTLILFGGLFIGRRLIERREFDWHVYVLGGGWLFGETGTLWFLTCLFFAQLAFGFLLLRIRDTRGPAMLAAMALMLVVGYGVTRLPYGTMTPLAIGVAPIAVVFLWAGHEIGRSLEKSGSIDRRLLLAGLVATLVCAALGFAGIASFGMDMKFAKYGTPVLGLLLAIGMSLLVLEACRLLDRVAVLNRVLRSLGQASLVIMLFHQAIIIAVLHHVASPWLRLAIGLGGAYVVYCIVMRVALLRLLFTGETMPRDKAALRARAATG